MSHFQSNKDARTPFGKNAYLRSTRDVKTRSYTFAHDSMPTVIIDGNEERVLQPGTVLATITSGADTGKVGVFQAAGSGAAEVQTITGGGTISGGTFDVTFLQGTGDEFTLTALAFDITAADFQAAVRAQLEGAADPDYRAMSDSLTITGGPVASTPFTITYGDSAGVDVPQVVSDDTNLTGTTPSLTDATSTPGAPGAIDGRGDTANIVGICDTFLPWQLLERDVEVSAVYEAACVQAWCFEYDASGTAVALGNTTRDAILARTDLALLFPA